MSSLLAKFCSQRTKCIPGKLKIVEIVTLEFEIPSGHKNIS